MLPDSALPDSALPDPALTDSALTDPALTDPALTDSVPSDPAPAEAFAAVVLAGGTGRRLGGVDKAALVVAGLPLLDRVLRATAAAHRTVVVGERRSTLRDVVWTRETPIGGGPVAGLAAGLAALEALGDRPSHVVLLATDLPWLGPDDVARLLAALTADRGADAVLFSDAQGRAQPLAGAYRTPAIAAALAAVGPPRGKAVKLVLHQLAVVTVPDQGAAGDCDTPDQLAAARAHFDRQG